MPQRGEKKEMVAHALTNAREALGRKLADTATQRRLLQAMVDDARPAASAEADRGLRQQPHPGHQRGRRHDRRRARTASCKNQYRKFNIKSEGLTPGDDYAMMREVLQRRFKRLLKPRRGRRRAKAKADDDSFPQWPDLVIIDGGRGQLNAAREIFAELGVDAGVAARRSPRGRTAMPAAKPCSCRSASRSSSSRAIPCCISSSGCATRRIAS